MGGIPELLDGERGTILPEVSSRAVVDALRAFRADPGSAAASAARLRQRVLEAYDVDRNAAVLIDIYRAAGAAASRA